MPGLRHLARISARPLLDGVALVAVVLAWTTGEPSVWLRVAYVAVAMTAFLSRSPWAVVGRSLAVTAAVAPEVIGLWSRGALQADELFDLPLVAGMAFLFAAFVVQRARAADRIAADRTRLEGQIDAIPFAVAAFDHEARALTWNTEAERLFGWSRREIVGGPNPIVGPAERDETRVLQRRVLGGERLNAIEAVRYARDGRRLDLALYTAPIDEQRPDQGFLVLYVDLSERKRAEEERDDANRRYQLLVESLPLVTYIDLVDDDVTNVYTSPQFETMCGWDPGEEPAFADLLHPDDRDRVMAHIHACNADWRPFVDEYRLHRKDGGYVWVRD
jgi:PAS domain S-box-containing protein